MNLSSNNPPVIRPKTSILDKSLSRGKQEVSASAFALLFSEIVQYYQSRSSTVSELQNHLHSHGWEIGARCLDLILIRDRPSTKREIKLLNVLLTVKSTLWKALFGKEADKLEHANDDEKTYYIIESEPLLNRYISVPKDKGSLNCASFAAGIIEAVLDGCNFPAKVSAHWHKGTTFMVKFQDHVIARDKLID
uniref:Trafficking protein particle complex subunit 5 n=1 Tax=Caligus clemensi TaxID=344056 RepID=C1C0Y1_CALCM|nr:Trafficking protein particle complex subunit 5 [Caligus clemensi]